MNAKFILDQMFDRAVLAGLRESGIEVLAVSELGMSTSDDAEIMQWAIAKQRVVITLDDHFDDWSILPLHAHSVREHLSSFPDLPLTADDFEYAAELFNILRSKGIQGLLKH